MCSWLWRGTVTWNCKVSLGSRSSRCPWWSCSAGALPSLSIAARCPPTGLASLKTEARLIYGNWRWSKRLFPLPYLPFSCWFSSKTNLCEWITWLGSLYWYWQFTFCLRNSYDPLIVPVSEKYWKNAGMHNILQGFAFIYCSIQLLT